MDHQHIAKIDREDDIIAPPKLSLTAAKAIQQARSAKQMTQKELGQKINEKATIINDYEMGRGTVKYNSECLLLMYSYT